MKFRILPVVVFFSLLVFGIKTADVILNTGTLSNKFLITELNAKSADDADESDESYVPEEKAVMSPDAPEGPKAYHPSDLSARERELLEGLAKRREELEEWGQSITIKENVLNATEIKIDKKLNELKKLKAEVETLLAEYNQKEDDKINRLVKIYENMKPKDAAKIFEEIDLPVLLRVVDRMKEVKAAPILAKLNPDRAKEITIALAKSKQLSIK